MTTPDPIQAEIAEALLEARFHQVGLSAEKLIETLASRGLTIVPLRAQATEPRDCPTPGACSCLGAQAALIEALEPFAKAADEIDATGEKYRYYPEDVWDAIGIVIKNGDLRKARAALHLARKEPHL